MNVLRVYLLVYGVLALSHIGVQMLLAHLDYLRQRRREPDDRYMPSVGVVVAAYNEDPDLLFECLRSLDRQDYEGDLEVVVVDDGSRNREELIPIQEEFGHKRFRTLLAPKNMGKRHCQAVVFNEIRTDVVVTIDSDTVLEPDSIRTIVRPLADDRIGAVTGNVRAVNQKQNFLTRLISYRYWSAFNQERAAQSLFRVVMCASGPFSAYRRSIIDQVKDRYVGQRFLGQACTFGDDRHLTNLVLDLGYGVVYDKDSIAWTHVPTTIPKYLRQQVRWNKSFYREILWTAKFAHRRHPYMGIDLTLQAVLPFMLLIALGSMLYQAIFVNVEMLWLYLGILVAIGLIRASYGLWRTRELGFLSFAVYGFMHVGLLIPTRLYALATIRKGHWGTRKRKSAIAEVRDDDLMRASTFGRGELEYHLAEARGRSQAAGERVAVMVLDIDGLRDVNLAHGHRAGERLVHEVSDVVRGRLGTIATMLRIGGDEFGIMLPGTDGVRAEAVARDLQEAIGSRLFSPSKVPVRISVSAGIAVLRPDAPEDHTLLRAEFAMYLAKEAGPDGLVLLGDEDLGRDQLAELEHVGRIRRALDQGALRLSAQPVLHIGSDSVEQWELLVRLRQEGDVIPAAEFLPTAERFGLVEHIDRWVVRRALGILAERSTSGEAVRLEVNLSRRSIGDPVLLDILRDGLDPELVRPWDLIIELREEAILAEPSAARAFAADVRALGCRIAVDDFSGADNQAAVIALRPDFVKISGDLVRHLPGEEADREAVRKIIALARKQGTQTIAQFVGDDETVALLGHFGADYVQGYHVGVPGPVSDVRPRRAPSHHEAPDARPSARRAHLGESLVLPGFDTQLRVAAMRVIDPLPNGGSGKAHRKRLVGIEVELENVGESAYAYVSNGGVRMTTNKGARSSSVNGRQPDDALQVDIDLQPGATIRGCMPFLVRTGDHVESFRFVPEAGHAAVAGEWGVN
jgi:hyaluronan synthase/N-acetylglucosaminyltransferase